MKTCLDFPSLDASSLKSWIVGSRQLVKTWLDLPSRGLQVFHFCKLICVFEIWENLIYHLNAEKLNNF